MQLNSVDSTEILPNSISIVKPTHSSIYLAVYVAAHIPDGECKQILLADHVTYQGYLKEEIIYATSIAIYGVLYQYVIVLWS